MFLVLSCTSNHVTASQLYAVTQQSTSGWVPVFWIIWLNSHLIYCLIV